MKTLVVLFADVRSAFLFEPFFDGRSAFERALDWSATLPFADDTETVIFAHPAIADRCRSVAEQSGRHAEIVCRESWTVLSLFEEFVRNAKRADVGDILYAFADCPFLSVSGAQEVFETHKNYVAEYTFADGFPSGLMPEALNAGCAQILCTLAESSFADEGKKPLSRSSVFDLIKRDINAFDVETVIAPFDSRLFRVSLCCASKAEAAACKAAYRSGCISDSPEAVARAACACVDVLKTVPSFYNIQICDADNVESSYIPPEMLHTGSSGRQFMSAERFGALVERIADFSGNAVVSVSAWGEPLLHPDFPALCAAVLKKPSLSLLIETDGLRVTEELCGRLKNLSDSALERTNGYDKVIWIVRLDAFTQETYAKIHGAAEHFERAVEAVTLLQRFFPECVYPQLVRMRVNECELERFYRFWSAKDAPAGGKHIIQKYSSFCGVLSDEKPADLSPLERNPCWHIRRDMTVLVDGSVPFCRECVKSNIIGNAFTDGIGTVWEKLSPFVQDQMHGKYGDFCGKCDEYYTFNF